MKFHATPIHCQATMTQVICLGKVELTPRESDTLIRDINEFTDNELQLFNQGNDWYCKSKPNIETTPLKKIIGRNIMPFFPTGADSKPIQQLSSELQMFLHNHPLNQQRKEQELPTIDTIWLWHQPWYRFLHA